MCFNAIFAAQGLHCIFPWMMMIKLLGAALISGSISAGTYIYKRLVTRGKETVPWVELLLFF